MAPARCVDSVVRVGFEGARPSRLTGKRMRDAGFEYQSHSERELGGSLGHLWGDSDRAMITSGGYFDTSRSGPFQTARDQVLRWVEFPRYRAESLTSACGGVCKVNRHFAALKRPDWSRPEDAHFERAESRFAGRCGT